MKIRPIPLSYTASNTELELIDCFKETEKLQQAKTETDHPHSGWALLCLGFYYFVVWLRFYFAVGLFVFNEEYFTNVQYHRESYLAVPKDTTILV